MYIKNGEINKFTDFLLELELSGKDSRMRTRLCKLLMERASQISEEHMALLEEFGKKNEDGTLVSALDEESGKRVFDLEDGQAFQREYYLLMSEDFCIKNDETTREMLESVSQQILTCDKTFKGEQALEYDRWCEIAESISC